MRCVVNYLSRKAAAFIRARLKTWLTAARSIASDQANVLICGFFLAEAAGEALVREPDLVDWLTEALQHRRQSR